MAPRPTEPEGPIGTCTLRAALSRIEANIHKLDDQLQVLRASVQIIDGHVLALLEHYGEDDSEDDATDDEATHSTSRDDQSDTDLSYIVSDSHESSSVEDGECEEDSPMSETSESTPYGTQARPVTRGHTGPSTD